MRVGIVAGETSGDLLGAELMASLQERNSDIEFVGIGGEQMISRGLECLDSIDQFRMNGFVEPLRRLPQLYALLHSLVTRLSDVDIMVGVDFNVFNFMLERRLKLRGIPTVHYVSPSVYAWRRGRTKRVSECADTLLALFPFEPDFYEKGAVNVVFVGHPLADEIQPRRDREQERRVAREELDVNQDATVIALLPGSRKSEIRFHGDLFCRAAARIETLLGNEQHCTFIVPCIEPHIENSMRNYTRLYSHVDIRLTEFPSMRVFAASDAALVKSGTSTLEAMLMRVPMTVAYRMGPITYSLIRSLLHTEWVALPNILTGSQFVPEFLQHYATSENLAVSLTRELENSRTSDKYFDVCESLHTNLRQNASSRAADSVLATLNDGN